MADPMERATLACFLAAQMVRTRAVLETQADMMARMTAWLKTQGAPDGFFEDDPNVGDGENADKALLARLITSAPRDLASTSWPRRTVCSLWCNASPRPT